ncbi:MAG TPA: NADH-ubiquinone oxidoreductase-F iron-sulfur binding region domain-containing protein [Gaiellaceae bacterium]
MTATLARGHLLRGVGRAPTLEEHVRVFGQAARLDVADVERAGLRGRGGAAFPTAAKLAVVAATSQPVVVANGAEGEPLSKKDRSLLRVAPHLVLDGALLAADVVGAVEVVIAVARPAPELEAAIGERTLRRTTVRVARVPDRFVAGEETALLRALGGGPAKPTTKPPYPFERGLSGRPTLVQNVETLAHLALVARGAFGSTALVTLSGAVARPGVHEIPLGITLADAVGELTADPAGYLVGGYFGRFVAPQEARTLQLTPDVLGAGAIAVLPASTCPVAEVARVVTYLAGESAGQCGPCTHGLPALAGALDPSRRGDHRGEARTFAALVAGRGACRHPDGAARFAESALDVFADDFARHAKHRGCGRRDEGVLP